MPRCVGGINTKTRDKVKRATYQMSALPIIPPESVAYSMKRRTTLFAASAFQSWRL
jgi:hypothetical protein